MTNNTNLSWDRKSEPIRPGDVVLYYSHIYPFGDKRGRTEATVISVDPRRKPILILSNSDFLPDSSQVARIQIMYHKKLIAQNGIFRIITDFVLAKKELAANIDIGFRSQGERVASIIKGPETESRMKQIATKKRSRL